MNYLATLVEPRVTRTTASAYLVDVGNAVITVHGAVPVVQRHSSEQLLSLHYKENPGAVHAMQSRVQEVATVAGNPMPPGMEPTYVTAKDRLSAVEYQWVWWSVRWDDWEQR
jgi:hypothetical protein